MICTLKQTFSIAYIHRMIPSDLTEEEVKARYDGYVRAHKSMGLYFIEQVRTHADGVLHPEDGTADTMVVDKLVFTSAIAANYYTLLAQKLTRLQGVAAIDQLDEIARIEESTKE